MKKDYPVLAFTLLLLLLVGALNSSAQTITDSSKIFVALLDDSIWVYRGYVDTIITKPSCYTHTDRTKDSIFIYLNESAGHSFFTSPYQQTTFKYRTIGYILKDRGDGLREVKSSFLLDKPYRVRKCSN